MHTAFSVHVQPQQHRVGHLRVQPAVQPALHVAAAGEQRHRFVRGHHARRAMATVREALSSFSGVLARWDAAAMRDTVVELARVGVLVHQFDSYDDGNHWHARPWERCTTVCARACM